MKSPGKILILWNKTVKKHEEGKKPEQFNKKGQEQKLKIKKGLTDLRTKARADLTNPDSRQKFEASRDRTAKLMRKYCRYLKSAKDEDKKVFPRYFKMVKQLTVLVEGLEVASLELNEEDVGLEAIEAIDVAGLDQALERPEVEAEEEEESAPEEGGPIPTAPPALPQTQAPPADTGRVAVLKRLNELVGPFKDALARKGPDLGRMQTLFAGIRTALDGQNYALAASQLDELEPLVAKANTAGAGTSTTTADPAQAQWKARLAAVTPGLKQALQSGNPRAAEIKQRFEQANGLAQQKSYAQAVAALAGLEGLFATDGTGANGAGAKKAYGDWEAALRAAATQIADLQKAVRAEQGVIEGVSDAADALGNIIPGFNRDLQGAVERAASAAPEQKDQAREQALAIVTAYEAYLNSETLIADAEVNPFEVSVSLREPLGQALAAIRAQL